MDNRSKEKRSENMSHIKSKGTKPEETVRKYLFSQGYRYRKNVKNLPGHPDIVLPKYQTVVFVNGCYWHGHEGCKYFVLPKSNVDFWLSKIEYNKRRDKENHEKLGRLGWNVLTIWECEIRHGDKENALSDLVNQIRSVSLH
jgi:DNA mismatch endonuclease (patch repair protein)